MPIQPSDKHIQRQPDQSITATSIPETIKRSVILPPPKPATTTETYSVVVINVSAQEILFALARDAKINLDIQSGIQGTVTINAINQTLPQILARIAKQVDMRYELDNGNLIVMPDTPYLHSYKIDYVNMARDSESSILTSGQGASSTSASSATGTAANNLSTTSIKDNSKNRFWDTLIQNIKDILHETDQILPEGSSETSVQQVKAASSTGTGAQPVNNKKTAPKIGFENSPNPISIEEGGTTITKRSTFREAASVIANPENGLITVRATGRQHEKIQEFIGQVMNSAHRQVMIEATIVEVHLSDQYQQGINWTSLIKNNGQSFHVVQSGPTILDNTLTGLNGLLGVITNSSTSITAQVALLESFGNVKVLSSPKLTVLNNQTAILRVVDNLVYFTVGVTVTPPTTISPSVVTYSTDPHTISVGFTMSVTPQISENDSVLFNLKPSISRITTFVTDPNPDLKNAGVINQIPQTQTREMESLLKIENNQIAVMGGLMQDSVNNLTDTVPGLWKIPVIGNLFQQRNDKTEKTELVIFLRPVVIKNASLDEDFIAYRATLPDQKYFKDSADGKP